MLIARPRPDRDRLEDAPLKGRARTLGRHARVRLLAPQLVLVALLTLPWSSVAAQQDPLTVVQNLLAALNAGNLDAAVALVADNATIRYVPPEYGPPNNCCTGKAAIRGAYGALVTGKSQFTPVAPLQAAGDTVTGRIRQTGAGVRASGLAFVDADVTFTVRDGLMVGQVVAFTPETIAAGFRGLGAPPPGLPSTGGGAGVGTPTTARLVTLACLGLGAGLIAGVRRRASSRR